MDPCPALTHREDSADIQKFIIFAYIVNPYEVNMKKYICDICGYEYDPAVGDPDNGIAPGTPFEALPADWVCPMCGVGKEDFSPVD